MTCKYGGCNNIKSLTLPDNLMMIKQGAFNGCTSLKSVTIPASVEYIYKYAFANTGLTEIKVLAETPPFAYDNTFSNYDIPLTVPEKSISLYQAESPWINFKAFKTLEGEKVEQPKCATPTITYAKGKLSFNCDTEGVDFVTDITDSDIKKHYGATIILNATYKISVYASKSGYENSDVASATLCWIEQQPQTEGIINGLSRIMGDALLISNNGSILSIQGLDDGTPISVYTIDGTLAGKTTSKYGQAEVSTSLQPGNVAIIKIRDKSIKVVMN